MSKVNRTDRPTRRVSLEDSVGFGRLNVTGIEDDPEFDYHVVNDKDNRIHQLQQRGYEIVENDGSIVMGDCNPKEAGSRIETTGDSKEGTKAVLMRVRKEWKQEDDAFKQGEIDKTESAIFRQLDDGQYGEIKHDKS